MKINEALNALDHGIFYLLAKAGKFTWLGADYAKDLDFEYLLNHSGEKSLSPLFEKLLEYERDSVEYQKYITDDDLKLVLDDELSKVTFGGGEKLIATAILTNIVYDHYGDKWNRIHDVFITTTYNPIENYSMTEKGTGSNLEKNTTNLKTSVNSNVDTTVSSKVTNDDSVYGFNSSSAVPQSTSTSQGASADNKTNVSGTATNNYTEVTGDGDSNKTDSSYTNNLSRSGNIGVTTTQQMLQSELDLREYDFVETMFRDLDKLLAKPMYL